MDEADPVFVDKNSFEYISKKEAELDQARKKRKIADLQFNHLGGREKVVKDNWMLDDKTLLKRAFETVFGNGLNHRKIDKKRVPPFHLSILVKNGYAKNLPNLSCCILTDKAFEDKDKILCTKN